MARPPVASEPAGEPNTGAWLLANLGAEEGPDAGRGDGGAPADALVRRVAALWALLFASSARLLSPRIDAAPWPEALGERAAAPVFDWLEDRGGGVPWLSTAEAALAIGERGLRFAAAAPEVVCEVHDKAFAHRVALELGLVPDCLVPLVHALSPEEIRDPDASRLILERVSRWPAWTRRRFTLKPRWGSSGRGRVAGEVGGRFGLSAGARERLARRGGALLEPWLERTGDRSAQLLAGASGEVRLLATTGRITIPAGIDRGLFGLLDPAGRASAGGEEEGAVAEAGLRLARRAAAAGYVGPCGVDAFAFRGPGGEHRLRPVVEMNARFTLGTVALGLLERARAAGRLEGARAWCFLLRMPPRLRRAADEGGARVLALGVGDDAPALLIADRASRLDAARREALRGS